MGGVTSSGGLVYPKGEGSEPSAYPYDGRGGILTRDRYGHKSNVFNWANPVEIAGHPLRGVTYIRTDGSDYRRVNVWTAYLGSHEVEIRHYYSRSSANGWSWEYTSEQHKKARAARAARYAREEAAREEVRRAAEAARAEAARVERARVERARVEQVADKWRALSAAAQTSGDSEPYLRSYKSDVYLRPFEEGAPEESAPEESAPADGSFLIAF